MFSALIGPALSFGSSLLSGLGAQQSAKKQQKIQQAYEYQNYLLQENYNTQRAAMGLVIQNDADDVAVKWSPQNVARDAQMAGFNPVTWANAFGGVYGAMTQFAQQQRLAGIEMQVNPSYMMSAPTAQVPSTLEAVGGALQAGVSTFLSDRRVAQSQDFQREMLQTQLSAIQRNGGQPLRLGSAPAASQTFFGSGSVPYSVTAGATRVGAPIREIGAWDPKAESAPFTNPYGYGSSIATGIADAGAMENRIGDADSPLEPGWYYKWWVTGNDISKNALGVNIPQGFRRGMAEVFGYPVYPDGARGLSWGRGASGYNPGELPGYGYATGGQF